jgi:putative acetyltransferase
MMLRPTKPDDTAMIQALVDEIYGEYDCRLYLDEEPHWIDPGPYFRETGGEFWVIEVEGEVRATGAVKLNDADSELKCLYVHPSLRGQGVAPMLIQQAIDHARAAGKEKMFLWTDTRFHTAHHLYRKLGFQEFGFRDCADSNNSLEYGFEMVIT